MTSIFHRESGTGKSIILLHGFPFQHVAWDPVFDKLSRSFRVLAPDLPGFGKSPLHASLSLESVADELIHWLRLVSPSNNILVGHSLGGYVALAIAERAPELLDGFCLFHSTALPDNEEKKQSREKVIEFVERNGAVAFTSNFIPPLFADESSGAIPVVRAIAMEAKAESIIAYTRAMQDRPDRQHVLQSSERSILIIAGQHDKGISVESLRTQALHSDKIEFSILEKSAHMGMYEQPEESARLVEAFRGRK